MNPYVKLGFAALLPIVVSVLFFLLDQKTPFKKTNYWIRQALYGLVFGGIAVLGTEYGVNIVGVTMNVRDASPICAGLIFGAPAGIIAGVIGGVERFFAAYWGAGAYSQIACSVATIFSGVFAAFLRKFMFEDKRPNWVYGLATGVIAEVLHMLILFLTHIDDARNAYIIVEKCFPVMAAFTGAAVMLALIFTTLLSGEKLFPPKSEVHISQIFQKYLLICILIAFVITSGFSYLLQSSSTTGTTQSMLKINIEDVKQDISDASDRNLLELARSYAFEIDSLDNLPTSSQLEKSCERYDVAEINIVDENGIIVASSNRSFVGFDMHSGSQSAAFLVLLDGQTKEFIQPYQRISYDASMQRKYAGVALDGGGFIQVAYDEAHARKSTDSIVVTVTQNRHIGENGYLIICDKDFQVVSAGKDGEQPQVEGAEKYYDELPKIGEMFDLRVSGEDMCCMYDYVEGYYIIAVYPKEEMLLAKNIPFCVNVFTEILIFTALFILLYILIKLLIVNKLRKIAQSLGKISNGNLDVVVDEQSRAEFASLSGDINATVDTLKQYIAEAKARIDKELAFAKAIQTSVLPKVFPEYSDSARFNAWAGMKPAKEVGGDFYDFYLLDDDHVVFLIADVSGKGIPAAMFMMNAKTLIKNLTERGLEANDVFTQANNRLCSNNDAGMFVTAWMGILDLNTGLVKFVNAGHNPPVIKRQATGEYEYLKSRPGLVLAGMEGIPYKINELQLEPGDTIFLYTDGVTEATNSQNELYGEQRLQDCLNATAKSPISMEDICHTVKNDVDKFVAEAPQFDDISMLCLEYNGNNEQ